MFYVTQYINGELGRFFKPVSKKWDSSELMFTAGAVDKTLPIIADMRYDNARYPDANESTRNPFLCPPKMSKTDVKRYVKAQLDYGSGYTCELYIEDEYISETLAKGMGWIKHGDNVELEIFTSKTKNHVGNVGFQVVNYREVIDKLRQTKKANVSMRDFQRQKVYDVESLVFVGIPSTHQSENQLKDFIKNIANLFGRKDLPKLVVKKGLNSCCYYDFCPNTIVVAESWGKNLRIVAHELAHWVLRGSLVPAHGKEFVYVVSLIYAMFLDVPQDKFFSTCDKFGVKYIHDYSF